MGKHGKDPLQQRLANLNKLLAALRDSFRGGQIDQKSYDGLQRSYRDDIAQVERQIKDNR